MEDILFWIEAHWWHIFAAIAVAALLFDILIPKNHWPKIPPRRP